MNGDVEAIFFFLDNKKVYEGYRPAHLIKEDYLTTGVHHYYKNDDDNEIRGTITFISPEYYPKSLWIGKILDMYEGGKKIGYAKIVNIFNPILSNNNCSYIAKIQWLSNENGGRKKLPPKNTRYCPIIQLDNDEKKYSIDFICPDFSKTDLIEFSFLVDNAPTELIENNHYYDLSEGEKTVATVLVLDKVYPEL